MSHIRLNSTVCVGVVGKCLTVCLVLFICLSGLSLVMGSEKAAERKNPHTFFFPSAKENARDKRGIHLIRVKRQHTGGFDEYNGEDLGYGYGYGGASGHGYDDYCFNCAHCNGCGHLPNGHNGHSRVSGYY